MKGVLVVLSLVILVLLGRLLSSEGGLAEYYSLESRHSELHEKLVAQQSVNERLQDEVRDLQSGHDAIETIARQKLGMVGENEIFVHVISVPVDVLDVIQTRQ